MTLEKPDNAWHVLRVLWAQLPFYLPTLMLIAFGQTLWLPGDTFGSSASFSVMAHAATEETWGYLLMAVGVAQFVATAFMPRWVALAVMLGVLFLLTYIAISIYCSTTVPSTGVRAYLLYVALGIWSVSHWDVKWRRT